MNSTSRGNGPNKSPLRWSSAFKILFLLIIIVGILAVGVVGALTFTIISESKPIDPKEVRALIAETSEVYDKDGKLVEKLVQNEYSEYVPLNKIPKHLQQAIVAIEDERFYEHRGMDFRRIAGSLIQNIKAGRIVQGGSTIPMQLAKNLYTSSEKSYARKIQDIYHAFQLESVLSKDEILEAYLNSAGFSKGTVGVQAAAKTFFDKDVSELDLAESALIVGITNRPSKYTPYNLVPVTDEDNLEEINLILAPAKALNEEPTETEMEYGNELLELGRIDAFENQQIQSGALLVRKSEPNPASKERQEVILHKMNSLGMIDEKTMNDAIDEPIVLKHGDRALKGISSYYVDAVKDEVLEILIAEGYSKEEAQHLLFNGGLDIHTSFDLEMQRKLEEHINNPSYYPGRHTDKKGIVQPQVGAVIMDHHTGQVTALVGGRGIGGHNILNRAKTPRQPGSSIKPISPYLTSFNHGGTAGDVYRDLPITKGPYKPKNSTGYRGYTTVRTLLVNSSNVGAYLVGKSLDPDADKSNEMMIETLQDLGITSIVTPEMNAKYNDQNFAALTLGGMTYGISPLEMAGAFSALANDGNFIKPSFVTKITLLNGNVLYENPQTEKEITSPANAYILTNILEDAVRRGTGRYANFSGMPAAGKTGTTNNKRDSWFVGYTPYYTASVWIGNDENTALWDHSRMAARLWRGFMKDIHQDLEQKEFEKPDGVYSKYLPGAGYTELFADGTSPKRLKDLYRNTPPKPKVKPKSNSSNKSSQNDNSQGSSSQTQGQNQGQGQSQSGNNNSN